MKKRYSKAFKEVDVKESIEKCLQLPFVLKATTKNELSRALVKEYGIAHGSLIYNHLKSVFAKSNDIKDCVQSNQINV
jgi:hypothetical protein